MATLDDLKGVLESINDNVVNQNTTLSSMFSSQERQDKLSEAKRTDNDGISKIGQAASGIGSGVGSTLSGAGGLIGGAGKGIGFAGAGIGAAFLGLSTVIDKIPDAGSIKSSVETLLSIGEGYENRLDFFLDTGILASALAGLGIGLAGFAIGAGATAGVQAAIEKFEMTDWPETVKENVTTLLSIGDDLTVGNLQLLLESGMVASALAGLGIGLAGFAIGSGAMAAVDYFSKDSNWAENVKSNVNTLLSIGDDKTLGALQVLGEGVGVSVALAGLGVGLAAFSAGQGVAAAVDYFSADDWATKVKSSVETLLSISDIPGIGWDTAGFIGVMTGLGAGLAVFALGKGVDTAIEGMDQALNYFTGEEDFAQRIYDQVSTLLSISDIPGIGWDTAKFVGVMGGLALGLAAFSLGKGVEGLTEGSQQAISYFSGEEDFAQRIYDQVSTLLGVVDLADEGKATSFVTTMATLSAGLVAFGAGEFVGSLASAGASIVSFFTGSESPFEQIRQIYQNSNELTQGADALERLTVSLDRIGALQFDGSKLNLKKFAQDLKDSVPIIEAAIMGEEGGLIFGAEIKGLASSEIDYDTAVKNIVMLRQALSGTSNEREMNNVDAVNSAGESGIGSTQTAVINNFDNRVTNNYVNGGDTLSQTSINASSSDLDNLGHRGAQ